MGSSTCWGLSTRFIRNNCRQSIRNVRLRYGSRFFSGDEGKHELRMNFVDADGASIMPDFPPVPVDVVLPEDMHFGTRNFIVNIQQLKFENPGLYSIDVTLDGQPQASIPLLVRHNPPAQPANEGPTGQV